MPGRWAPRCGLLSCSVWLGAARASQIELHPGVTRAEAQSLVETAGLDAALVGRELYQPATPIARTADRPFHQAGSDPLTSQVIANPDPFHLSSPRPLKG